MTDFRVAPGPIYGRARIDLGLIQGCSRVFPVVFGVDLKAIRINFIIDFGLILEGFGKDFQKDF